MDVVSSKGGRTPGRGGPRRSTALRAAAGSLALTGLLALAATAAGASPSQAKPGSSQTKPASGTTWNPDPTADTQPPTIPDGTSVAVAQAWVESALALRQGVLGALSTNVGNATDLPASVRSSINAELTSVSNGVAALATAVGKQSTLAALRTSAATMVTAYHVYAVVQPQVRLLLGAEHQLAVAAQIARLEPALQTAIQAERSSKSSSTLRALATSLSSGVAGIESSASGVVTDMLSQTPSDETDAAPVIVADTTTIAGDWTTIAAVRGDVTKILSDLAGNS